MFHFPFLHSVLAGDAQMSSGWRGDHRQTPGKTLWPGWQMEQFSTDHTHLESTHLLEVSLALPAHQQEIWGQELE